MMTVRIAILLLPILLLACSPDIDLIGEGEPVPIVYSILDAADSVHYVKIMKSFSGEASAQDLLQEDLLYYDQLQVQLTQINTSRIFFFERVAQSDKKPGFFPQEPNYVYRLEQVLDPGQYELTVSGQELDQNITKNLTLFSDMKLIYPAPLTKRIYFYDDPISFSWNPSSQAASYELAFVLTFEEATDEGIEQKTVSYSREVNLEELEWYSDRLTFRLYSDPFFASLGRQISVSDLIHYRKPINLKLSLTAADDDLSQFINQINPDTPIETHYTGNLSKAIGIVASKYSITLDHKALSPKAMDSLRSGRFTENLRFIANSDW